MSSWFYKLRRKRSAGFVSEAGIQKPPPLPLPPKAPASTPCSPNRASYYVPSRDRERDRALSPRTAKDNPKLRDTQFPRSPQPSDIVFDVVARRDDRFGGGGVDTAMMLELKLRPILTKPAPRAEDDSSSGAAPPTARVRRRLHVTSRRHKAAPAAAATPAETCRRRRQSAGLRWLYESVVVEKDSAEPEEDFLASMAEMIAAHGVRSPRGLEDLLACYLALNAADHHRAIVAAFRRAWLHHRAPPTTRER
ncbi:hypothetical protein EJB05_58020, partial [Eragrostis curvula]